jgi:hypothetical protein
MFDNRGSTVPVSLDWTAHYERKGEGGSAPAQHTWR